MSKTFLPRKSKFRKISYTASCGCRCMVIDGPAGECPAKLTGTDKESVATWIEKVMDAGHNKSLHYSLVALKYFVRNFYEFKSPEWRTVVAHIVSLNDEIEVEVDDFSDLQEEEVKEEEVKAGVKNLTAIKVEKDDDFSDLEEDPF